MAGHGEKLSRKQEDAIAARCQFFDDCGSLAGEEPAANLESADDAAQAIGQRARLTGGIDVERD